MMIVGLGVLMFCRPVFVTELLLFRLCLCVCVCVSLYHHYYHHGRLTHSPLSDVVVLGVVETEQIFSIVLIIPL